MAVRAPTISQPNLAARTAGGSGVEDAASSDGGIAGQPGPVPVLPNDGVDDVKVRDRRQSLSGGDRRTDTSARERANASSASTPVVKASTLKPRPAQALTLPDGIAPEQRALLDQALAGGLGAEAKGALTALITSSSFGALPPRAQAAALGAVAPAPAGMVGGLLGASSAKALPEMRGKVLAAGANQLRGFLSAPAMREVAPADRERMLAVWSKAGMARTDLQSIASKPGALSAKDAKGGTLVDSLSALSSGPLAPGLDTERAWLLSSTIAGVARPEVITQESRGTCSVTAMSQMLAKAEPAEYARLVAGLSTPEGRVALKNGDVITRVTGTERQADSGRTPPERLLQPALLEYGNGDLRYDNARDVHLAGTREAKNGLVAAEERRVMDGLFGKAHTASGRNLDAYMRDANVLERLGTFGEGVWERMTFRRDSANPADVLRARSGQDTLANIAWSRDGHAVVVEKIENGRVYFRNPQGNGGRPRGTLLDDPPRRVENDGARQSMTETEFMRRLKSVVH